MRKRYAGLPALIILLAVGHGANAFMAKSDETMKRTASAQSENSTPPLFAGLKDNAVVLSYDAMGDIHTPPDPNLKPWLGWGEYNVTQILQDLVPYVHTDSIDFVFLYSLQPVAGWIAMYSQWVWERNTMNIGRSHTLLYRQKPENWGRLRCVPQMNALKFTDPDTLYIEAWETPPESMPHLVDPNITWDWLKQQQSTLTAFHEIYHCWGVYFNRMPQGYDPYSPDYHPMEHPISWLACPSGHWISDWDQNWMPGIMFSNPASALFNEFDLYAMGLYPYEDLQSVVHHVQHKIRNPETHSYQYQASYPVTIDSLIAGLKDYEDRTGADTYEGDGRRIPATDPTMKKVNTLIVIIKERREMLQVRHIDWITYLAENMESDWHAATWGRSEMNVRSWLIDPAMDVGEPSDAPELLFLHPNYPNPFNPQTTIGFILTRPEHAELTIFNPRGQKVRTLATSAFSTGYHTITWDAEDDHGNALPSGIYLYVLKTDSFQRVRKMSLIR